MINKQNIWFVTLFSLILVLSIYYITMPSDLLQVIKENNNDASIVVNESDILTALRVEKDDQREIEIKEINNILNDNEISADEKNNAFEKLKFINSLKTLEDSVQKKIKEEFKVDAFVKIDENNQVRIVVNSKESNLELANNIMRITQEQFKDKMYISVKFEK